MANFGSMKLVQAGVFSPAQAYADVLGPGLSPPVDTQVAEFRFYDTNGVVFSTVPADATVILEDDAGGRFYVYNPGGTNKSRFKLRHTAVVCDFEQSSEIMAQSLPLRVKATISGVSVVQTFKLLKNLTAIAPKGDQSVPPNVKTYSTFAEFAAHLNNTGGNMTIEPAAGLVGGLRKASYSGDVIFKGFNKTIKGTKDIFLNQRAALLSGDFKDSIIKDMAFAVGTSDATPTAKKDIDNATWGTKTPTSWTRDQLIERFISIASNDENQRMKERCRRMHFRYGIFVYEQYPANHTKSELHPHCVSISDRAAHIIHEKCIYVGDTRMIQHSLDIAGVVQVNCMSIGWEDAATAILFKPTRGSLAEAGVSEVIAEGNLLMLLADTPAKRSGAISFLRAQTAKTQVYVPQDGPYVNQFIRFDKFTPDPVTVANGGITFVECDSPTVLKTTPNFKYNGVTKWKTGTEVEIKALYDHLTDPTVVGNGSKLCIDVLAKIRAGTIERWLSPAQMDALYGPPNAQGVPWMGGGSMGHGIV